MDHAAVAARVLDVEARALRALADAPPATFDAAVNLLLGTKGHVVTTGVGKSGAVARKIAATFASTGAPAFYVHPGEASHGDLGALTANDLLLALSWSGETAELSDIIAHARDLGAPLIAITAGREGMLAKAADVALIPPEVEEACRITAAPTTSTLLQMALGDALAVARLEAAGFDARDFRRRHPGGRLGARLALTEDVMRRPPDLPLVAPGTAMTEALLEMSAKRMGCTGVVDAEGRLVGLITDGDVRRAMGTDLMTARAQDVMTRRPATIAPETPAGDVLVLFNDRAITNAFVVDADGRPVGAVHIHDLLRLGL